MNPIIDETQTTVRIRWNQSPESVLAGAGAAADADKAAGGTISLLVSFSAKADPDIPSIKTKMMNIVLIMSSPYKKRLINF